MADPPKSWRFMLRWLVALVIGPALFTLLWSFVVMWSRDGELYFGFSLVNLISAWLVAAIVGVPVHLLIDRTGQGLWSMYAITGAILALGMYLLGWLIMSLFVNEMSFEPAVSYSLTALGMFPDTPLALLCGLFAGLVFWRCLRTNTRTETPFP